MYLLLIKHQEISPEKMGCEHKDVIGHVGSFSVKNQFMIDVFSNYVQNSQAVLWFIGDGPLQQRSACIEKNLTEKVILG